MSGFPPGVFGGMFGYAFPFDYRGPGVRQQHCGIAADPSLLLNAYRPTPEQQEAWERERITRKHVAALRDELWDDTLTTVWTFGLWATGFAMAAWCVVRWRGHW